MKTFGSGGGRSLGIFVFLFALDLNAGPPPQSVRVERRDGMTVIRNPAKPAVIPGDPKGIRLVPELTIGSESDPDERMIFEIRALQADAGGNIYVLDSKIGQVKVYDSDGRYLRTFGKKGQGPGELQSPGRMVMTADGNLCFLDLGNNRVSVFSPEGKCLKETPLIKWRPFRFIPDSKGSGYGDILDFKDGVANVLAKLDAKLNKTATIASLVIAANPNDQMIPIELFRLIYQVDNEDRIVWASTGEYELNVVDPDGKQVKKIIRDYNEQAYSRADKEKLIKDFFRGQGPPSGAVPFFPPHHPVLYYFVLDDEGRYYVRTYETDGQGGFFHDVFDKDGRYFARFALPEEEIVSVIKKGKVYCYIPESKDGIPQVNRYAIVWE
jgi:hypothetical protein